MRCPKCGEEFGDGVSCANCGVDRVSAFGKYYGFGKESPRIEMPGMTKADPPSQYYFTVCYQCGNVIPSGSKFCPFCTVELYASCPKCGFRYSSQYPACPKCGTDRAKYLAYLEEQEKKRLAEEEERRKREAEEEKKRLAEEEERRKRRAQELVEAKAAEQKRRAKILCSEESIEASKIINRCLELSMVKPTSPILIADIILFILLIPMSFNLLDDIGIVATILICLISLVIMSCVARTFKNEPRANNTKFKKAIEEIKASSSNKTNERTWALIDNILENNQNLQSLTDTHILQDEIVRHSR